MTKRAGAGRGTPSRSALNATRRANAKDFRRRAGPLRNLLLAPRTVTRYTKGVNAFFKWILTSGRHLPHYIADMDDLCTLFVESLWEEGDGLAFANAAMAGLQHPTTGVRSLKGNISGTWLFLKCWKHKEIPVRAPPLPMSWIHAGAGVALKKRRPHMALFIYVGVHCLLRTCELLGLNAGDVTFADDLQSAHLDLGLTKGGQRKGIEESVTIECPWLVAAVRAMTLSKQPGDSLFGMTEAEMRRSFADIWKVLLLDDIGIKPYSLRRTGATEMFRRLNKIQKVMGRGRWAHATTARVYINDGLSLLRSISTTAAQRTVAAPYAQLAMSRLSATATFW